MNMNKRIVLTIVLAMNVVIVMAQNPPKWIYNLPKPSNDTYLYVRGTGEGLTEREARNEAYLDVLFHTASIIGVQYDSEEIFSALMSGKDYKTISSTYDIPVRQVCDYIDKKALRIKVFILCQVAKTGESDPNFDEFNACNEGGGIYYAEDALYADGYSVYRDGVQLSDSEIRTMFANTKSYYLYDSGKRKEDNFWYYYFGAVGCFVGAMCQMGWMYGWEQGRGSIITGFVFGGCGIGLIATGSICSSIGRAKIRKAVDLYNNGKAYSQNNMEIKYGLTGNGVFLSFSF